MLYIRYIYIYSNCCDGCAGDWDAAGKRDATRPAAEDEEEDADAFGDFEDLETGQPWQHAVKVLRLRTLLFLIYLFSFFPFPYSLVCVPYVRETAFGYSLQDEKLLAGMLAHFFLGFMV